MKKDEQIQLIEANLAYTEVRNNLSKNSEEIDRILEKASFMTQLKIFRALGSKEDLLMDVFGESFVRAMERELKPFPNEEEEIPDWFFKILDNSISIPSLIREDFNLHLLRIYRDLLEQSEED